MVTEAATREKAVVTKALASIGDIDTLPEVTVRIIEIVEDSRSTVRDLYEIIKRDPALSTKVLKVVNSAYYGLPGQIASVDRAIILLGLSAVKNIAIAASIARLFKGGRISSRFSARDLWRHSVAVGVASRAIAKATGMVGTLDEVLLAGLIHDLGILVERQAFPEQLAQVIDRCGAGDGTLLELEAEIIGVDHQTFGDVLTAKWQFPRNLRAAIGFHHCPERVTPELRPLSLIVHTADILCCEQKLGFYLSAANDEHTDELLNAVGITVEQLEQIGDCLEAEVDEAQAMLLG